MDNIAPWFIYLVGIALILSAFTTIALGLVGIGIMLFLKGVLTTEFKKDILPSIAGTLRNVEKISTDAADTTHNVTGAVNRVSNLVGGAASKLESPVIRMVGLAAGLMSGARAVKGSKPRKTEVIVEKKRKGLFG